MATLYSLGAVTIDGYRVHTGDMTTAGTVVSGALVEAGELLDDELRRNLAWQSRTDKLRIYPDGRVYPYAYPITTAATLEIDGRSLVGAEADETPFVGRFGDLVVNLVTVTWSGGYDDGTNSDPLPTTLKNAIFELARALTTDTSAIPVGATSVRVGDVSVTYAQAGATSHLDSLVPGLTSRISRYRNRYV